MKLVIIVQDGTVQKVFAKDAKKPIEVEVIDECEIEEDEFEDELKNIEDDDSYEPVYF